MPLNLELQKNAAQQQLQSILSGQMFDLPTQLNQIKSGIQSTRNFAPASSFLSGLGISAPTDNTFQTNRLDRELNKNIAGSQLNISRQNLSNRQSALGQFQDQSIAARRAAEGFGRNVQGIQSGQLFQSQQNAADRQLSLSEQGISENLSKSGLNLQGQYINQTYGDPITRMLATLGGTVGTSLLLRQAMMPKTSAQLPSGTTQSGYGGDSEISNYG